MAFNCLNRITITCDKIEHAHELDKFIDELRYLNNNENQMYKNIYVLERGERGLVFNFSNMWNGGDFKWLDRLLEKYRNCWVKNEWFENNGLAGIWVGYINRYNQKDVKQLSWNDLTPQQKKLYFMK
jgi:hypothetical protein